MTCRPALPQASAPLGSAASGQGGHPEAAGTGCATVVSAASRPWEWCSSVSGSDGFVVKTEGARAQPREHPRHIDGERIPAVADLYSEGQAGVLTDRCDGDRHLEDTGRGVLACVAVATRPGGEERAE